MSWGKNPKRWSKPLTVRLSDREHAELAELGDWRTLKELAQGGYPSFSALNRTDTLRALIRFAAAARKTPPAAQDASSSLRKTPSSAGAAARKTPRGRASSRGGRS